MTIKTIVSLFAIYELSSGAKGRRLLQAPFPPPVTTQNPLYTTQPGYTPNQVYPNQGYPNQGYPNQGYPNQGYPNQGYPNQYNQGYPLPAQTQSPYQYPAQTQSPYYGANPGYPPYGGNPAYPAQTQSPYQANQQYPYYGSNPSYPAQPAATTTAAPYHYTTAAPYNNNPYPLGQNGPFAVPQQGYNPVELNCAVPYTAGAASCAGTVKSVQNPPNEFKLYCKAQGACAQSVFNFLYTPTGTPVEFIAGIWASEQYALYKTTINIVNNQHDKLILDSVNCVGSGACVDAKFVLTNTVIGDFICDSGACTGCTIVDKSMMPETVTECAAF